MALFVIPVGLKAAASFIGANGVRAATKKYGPKVVKEAQEAIAKRQASISAKQKMSGPSKGSIARSAETNKVAARIPGDKNLLNFLKLVDEPIISTSANLSGHRACKNIKEISTVFDGKIFGALDSQLGGEKKPSRILDLENNEYIR